MSPILGIVLSFLSGYISLSIEILWIRLMGIHSHGDPKGFSYTLGFFLIGMTIGALFSQRNCQKDHKEDLFKILQATFLFMGTFLYFAIGLFVKGLPYIPSSATSGILFLLLTLTSILTGIAYPVITHLSLPKGGSAGVHVALISLGSILGSTAGSMLAGFYFLEVFSLERVLFFMGLLSLVTGTFISFYAFKLRKIKYVLLALVFLFPISFWSRNNLSLKLFLGENYEKEKDDYIVVENRIGALFLKRHDLTEELSSLFLIPSSRKAHPNNGQINNDQTNNEQTSNSQTSKEQTNKELKIEEDKQTYLDLLHLSRMTKPQNILKF
jgi:MFS family permease